MSSSTCRTLSAIIEFRIPLSLIEDPSLWLTFGSNCMNVWAPISFEAQHIIPRRTTRPRGWTKSLKTCSAFVFWLMVRSGTNTFHWQSSPTTIITKRASRCQLLKHSMDDLVAHHWVGLSWVKGLSLIPTLWQRQKRVKQIRANILTAQSRQKSYTDKRHCPLEFEVGDHVYLQISPIKGVHRFGIKGEIAPVTSACILSSTSMGQRLIKWSYRQSYQEFITCFMSPNSKDVWSPWLMWS
jgi:hypothetical protein